MARQIYPFQKQVGDYFQSSNSLVDVVMPDLGCGNAYMVLLFIFRNTYGRGQTAYEAEYQEIMTATSIQSVNTLKKALKLLATKRLIQEPSGVSKTVFSFRLNTGYSLEVPSKNDGKEVELPSKNDGKVEVSRQKMTADPSKNDGKSASLHAVQDSERHVPQRQCTPPLNPPPPGGDFPESAERDCEAKEEIEPIEPTAEPGEDATAEDAAPLSSKKVPAPPGKYKRPHIWRGTRHGKGDAFPPFVVTKCDKRLWPIFCRFWRLYPKKQDWYWAWERFVERATFVESRKRQIDMESVRAIFAGLRRWKQCPQWAEAKMIRDPERFLKHEQYLNPPQMERGVQTRIVRTQYETVEPTLEMDEERKTELTGYYHAFLGAMRYDRNTLTAGKEVELWKVCDVIEKAGYTHNDIAVSARTWREQNPRLSNPTVSQIQLGMGAIQPTAKALPAVDRRAEAKKKSQEYLAKRGWQ